jgi:cytochrome c
MRSLLMTIALSFTLASPAVAGDPVRGQELYESRCIGCHSPDANRVGPKHRGVVGRVSGTLRDFNYSNAVKRAQVTWDEQSLDRWLTDPQAFIPGQKMNFPVNDPTDRADLIAYLKTLN